MPITVRGVYDTGVRVRTRTGYEVVVSAAPSTRCARGRHAGAFDRVVGREGQGRGLRGALA
eukprot:3170079-Alexandrium_andersonii.AAC.1